MDNHLTLVEIAQCLGVSIPEADRIIKRSALEASMIGGQKRFRRDAILHWLEGQFGSLTIEKLRNVDLSNASNAGLDPSQPFVTQMLECGNIHPMVPARTRASILRTLSELACATGATYDEHSLLEQLLEREEISSTALPIGIAFPHPRDMRRIYTENDILILARTAGPLPFGAPGGRLTGMFFLLLFPDPSVHLHVLARLNRMLRDPSLVEALEEAAGAFEMLELLRAAEHELLPAD